MTGSRLQSNGQARPPAPFVAPEADAALIRRVEAIVREVLAGLLQAEAPRPDAPPGGEHFSGRLLGERHVEALPPGTRSLLILPGTVITPLARDGLKRRGIALCWSSPDGSFTDRDARGEWGVAIEENTGTASALRRALLDDAREPWNDLGNDLDAAAGWVAQADGRGAVMLTPESSLATWRACQVANVRAATVADADAVERACRHLGANFLVIEPAGQSIYALKQLCATFRRAGAPRLPQGLEGSHDGTGRGAVRPTSEVRR